ncbi:MAG: DUF1858 domain-containing protein [Clostridia bacterium]|nr:DUF1858 domain-containing protein [Clostridia bacterium]
MKKKKIIYTKDMTLGQIMNADPENSIILMGFGMHCCGCPMSQMETLEQACEVHELDLDFVLARLNEK